MPSGVLGDSGPFVRERVVRSRVAFDLSNPENGGSLRFVRECPRVRLDHDDALEVVSTDTRRHESSDTERQYQ